MSNRPTQPLLIPVFVGMLINVLALGFLMALAPYFYILFLLVHHIGVGIYAWDAYTNPRTTIATATLWAIGFYFLWFICMPAYAYLDSRQEA